MPLLFTYGSLMKDLALSYYLDDSKYLGTAWVKGLQLYEIPDAFFPAVLPDSDACVKGECYQVSNLLMRVLDMVESVRSGLYVRKKVDTLYGEAIVYVAGPALEDDCIKKIETGDWREHVSSNSPKPTQYNA